MHVGEKVRKIRNEKKLSLRQLATMTDMNHAYLSRIENGKVQPSVESLTKIAKALGCDVADFFDKKMEVDDELKKEGVQWVIFGKELEKEGITLEQVKEWIRAIKATKL